MPLNRIFSGHLRGESVATFSMAGRAVSASFVNQLVSSATNFALAFFLVRSLTTAEYGLYGIGLSICYLYAGAGNALFLTQMVVHTPDKSPDERPVYAARVLVGVAAFCAATSALAGLAACIATVIWPTRAVGLGIVGAIAAASITFLVKDFFVRQAYTARAEVRALLVTCAVGTATLAILVTIERTGAAIDATGALLVFAASQAVGIGFGLLLARLPLRAVAIRGVVDDFRESWRHGRWAIGGVAVTWSQSQAYAYVTMAFAGAAEVGRANAARLLVSPFLVVVPAINQVAMPRFAAMRAADPRRMVETGRSITTALLALALLYSAVLLLAADWIVPALLGSSYLNMRPLIAAWCAVLAAMLLRDTASTMLQALKRFRTLTLLNGATAAVSLAAVAAFMATCGEAGAIIGTAVGEVILAALLWRNISNERSAVG